MPEVTIQTDNADAAVLWSVDNRGDGRLVVGSDPLEVCEWRCNQVTNGSQMLVRVGARGYWAA
jgi:hypothetical protein